MKKILIMLLFILPAWLVSAADSGNMLGFDGTDDVATVTDATFPNFVAQEYTLEAWVKLTSFASDPRILQRKDSFALYVETANQRVVFQSRSGALPLIASANNSVHLNQWHHVAVRRYEETPGVYRTKIILDGVPCLNTSTHADFQLANTGETVLVGNNAAATTPLQGKVDEVRIWDVGLDDATIKAQRGTPLTGAELNLIAYFTFDEVLGSQTFTDLTGSALTMVRGSTNLAQVTDPTHVRSTAPIGHRLISPNGDLGDPDLVAGDTLTIKWAFDADVDSVAIQFWRSDINQWDYLIYKILNTGAFETYVPGFITTNALFRVINPFDVTQLDESDNFIVITDPGNWKKSITFEAEDADTFVLPMTTVTRGRAFYCEAITSPKGRQGEAIYNFNVTKGGLYVIWGRVLAPTGLFDSFYVSVDDAPYNMWDLTDTMEWSWQLVSHRGPDGNGYNQAEVDPFIVSLTPGVHKLSIKTREHYTELDRIYLTNDFIKRVSDGPTKWIQLVQPFDSTYDGCDVPWGEPFEIQWKSKNISDLVTIELSFDSGATYPIKIADATENDGSFIWDVPNYGKKYGFLRISDGHGGHCPWDASNIRFNFVAPQPKLIVVAPNGGEIYTGGTVQNVIWNSLNYAGKTNIDFSPDNGATWTTIAANQPNSGTFAWTVPDINTTIALIKAYDPTDADPVDVSDTTFTIIQPPPPEKLFVIFPNGAENLIAGNVYDIWWRSEDYAGLVNIDLSLNNGQTWTTLATNKPDSGTFAWTVPNIVANTGLVRVYDPADLDPADQSDAVFSIIQPQNEQDFALYFDGLNDYVEVPNDAALNVANNFTIEFWIMTTAPSQNNTRVLEKGAWDEYLIGFYGNTGKMSGALRTPTGPGTSKMSTVLGPSQTVLASNVWYHIAATYNGTTACIYINGILERSKPAIVTPRQLLGDLIIGAVKQAGNLSSYLNATLDELRIWNSARSVIQINTNMYNELIGNEAGLVAYYNFNEGTGQVLTDLAGAPNNGRLGATVNADASDPVWIISDRPTTAAAMAGPTALLSQEALNELEAVPLPEAYDLMQNYPNPFNPGTSISFAIPDNSVDVVLEIYDLQGRFIKMLVNGVYNAGTHEVYWNGTTSAGTLAASGTYFYRLRAGDFTAIKRMLFLK